MIFMESKLRISDNSGVRKVKCISASPYRGFSVGQTFMVSVSDVKPRRRVKKGQLWRCLLIRMRKPISRAVGLSVSSTSNAGILLKREEDIPYANRMKSPAFLELRRYGFSKILSMTKFVI